MKNHLHFLRVLLVLSALILSFASLSAKEIKISVTPDDAKIYIDGNYMGDGTVIATIKRSDGFISVKCEKPGYVTMETKIYYNDKRKAVSYTLRRDSFFDVTSASGLVNKYFTVKISKDLYSEDENGKRNTELAWKEIHNIILNYFDEIQTTDIASGFVQTPWMYKSFPEADRQVRSRVSVREVNFGGDLTFQIKISSEAASLIAPHRDEAFVEIDRILKDLEPLIGEFQSRLGK